MSQFNFIYAEEHLSHREKTVYIYLRDRADASGVCGLWQIWSAGSSLKSKTVAAPTAASRAIYTG